MCSSCPSDDDDDVWFFGAEILSYRGMMRAALNSYGKFLHVFNTDRFCFHSKLVSAVPWCLWFGSWNLHLMFRMHELTICSFVMCSPLRSIRQHLSYDDWRIRGKIIRTVLCYIVQHICAQSYAHWYEQFLQMNCFRSRFCVFTRSSLFLLGLVYFRLVVWLLWVPAQLIAWKDSSLKWSIMCHTHSLTCLCAV